MQPKQIHVITTVLKIPINTSINLCPKLWFIYEINLLNVKLNGYIKQFFLLSERSAQTKEITHGTYLHLETPVRHTYVSQQITAAQPPL